MDEPRSVIRKYRSSGLPGGVGGDCWASTGEVAEEGIRDLSRTGLGKGVGTAGGNGKDLDWTIERKNPIRSGSIQYE
ncbi:hypothetical protein GCM10010319_05500 [Streptomyces blastmyceticus]|uniref:Uncharacterized protein n=1 Tax=Streptomyces blastmyceticus TaxID=68180 RepID=A0ABP3G2J4_9ACTN